jgi:Na+/H+-translocating membrane pyrophosphatase
MNKISDQIKSGARAFLVTEYKYLAIYVVFVFAVLVLLYSLDPPTGNRTDGIRYGGCFVVGSSLSALAGWCGMSVATDANVRTTQAADKQGLAIALRVAFTGGAVMGFTVVGLGLFGLSLMYWLVSLGYDVPGDVSLRYAAEAFGWIWIKELHQLLSLHVSLVVSSRRLLMWVLIWLER